MRKFKMTNSPKYPFSDLTPGQVEDLVRGARMEQAQAVRNFFAKLFRFTTRRQAQVWQPNHVPAFGMKTSR
jgi:hypothetical protein